MADLLENGRCVLNLRTENFPTRRIDRLRLNRSLVLLSPAKQGFPLSGTPLELHWNLVWKSNRTAVFLQSDPFYRLAGLFPPVQLRPCRRRLSEMTHNDGGQCTDSCQRQGNTPIPPCARHPAPWSRRGKKLKGRECHLQMQCLCVFGRLLSKLAR